MSEAFDPEKIERYSARRHSEQSYGSEQVVRAADYDKLLALYRELQREIDGLHENMAGESL